MSDFTEHDALKEAVEMAIKSPCAKSKRGIVIFRRTTISRDFPCGVVIAASNHPPDGFQCGGPDSDCIKGCGRLCGHAETNAIALAARVGITVHGLEMLHIKVNEDGVAVPSAMPSCSQCSPSIIQAGISVMWLLQEGRGETAQLIPYSPKDFHAATLLNNGLPIHIERQN